MSISSVNTRVWYAQCGPLEYTEAFTLISHMQKPSFSVRKLSSSSRFLMESHLEREKSLNTIPETCTSTWILFQGLTNSSYEAYLETYCVLSNSISIYWTTPHLCLTQLQAPWRTKKSQTSFIHSAVISWVTTNVLGSMFKFLVSQDKSTSLSLKLKKFSRED